MKNLYASLFGESPATQQARENRDLTFQGMLSSRRQATQQNYTDNVKMARYNALGNVLTTMVQPLGWAAGGSTANVQKSDDRRYIDAFNRAVQASDDLRNIGMAEDQYRFNLAEQDYQRARAMDDAARERAFKEEDLERKYQQKMEEQQRKYENDIAKINRQGEIRQQIAEFNAMNKIKDKSTNKIADWRTQQKLIQGYLEYAEKEKIPLTYQDWLKTTGFEALAPAATSTTTKPTSSVNLALS